MDNKNSKVFNVVVLIILIILLSSIVKLLKIGFVKSVAGAGDSLPCVKGETVSVSETIVLAAPASTNPKSVEVPVEVIVETAEVRMPAGTAAVEKTIVVPEEPRGGNRGYTTKDGKSTYRPSADR